MLTKRLTTLVKEGLFKKIRYSEHPPREEYLLTPAGQDILPVLFVLGAWGQAHKLCETGARMPVFIDSETGLEIEPIVVDKITGVEIGKATIKRKKSIVYSITIIRSFTTLLYPLTSIFSYR